MSRRAIILAGGKGTRLYPYTVVLPKPLLPIGEFPILEVIVRQLVQNGFEHITMAVNHHAEIIKAFFQDGAKWGVKIDYSLEDRSLSTMGPLRIIKDLPDNFLVMNGDILTDLNYKDFFDQHVSKNNIFTISAYSRKHNIDYGVLEIDLNENLTDFKEKPSNKYLVSMGVYMVNSHILNFIPPDQAYGFDNLMHDLILIKKSVAVRKFSGYWLDIGRPDDYAQAIEEFDSMRERFLSE